MSVLVSYFITSSSSLCAGITCKLYRCEEKLIAVNEALSMESNKSSGANPSDEVKTLSQRQNELATLIMKSAAKDMKNKMLNRPISADGKVNRFRPCINEHQSTRYQNNFKLFAQNKKQQGGMSKNVINSNAANLPLSNAIMVCRLRFILLSVVMLAWTLQ